MRPYPTKVTIRKRVSRVKGTIAKDRKMGAKAMVFMKRNWSSFWLASNR